MNGNYVKICRSLLNWEWYNNLNVKAVFIHCLLKANWKEGRFEGQVVERGSFITSLPKMAYELGMSIHQVRTAIDHLKATGEVTVKTTNKFSVITVNNYNQYQDADSQDGSQMADKWQADGSQMAVKRQTSGNNRRKKEEKESKEGKKENKKESFYPNDEKLDQAFLDYVEMRKAIKAPMTDRAIALAMSKLKKLAAIPFSDMMDNDLAIEILNQSTMNSWKGLFPLKEESKLKKESDIREEWRKAL